MGRGLSATHFAYCRERSSAPVPHANEAGFPAAPKMTAEPKGAGDRGGEDPPPSPRQPIPSATGTGAGIERPAPADASTSSFTGFHAAVPQRHHVEAHPTGKRLAILSVTALGIVYGDIGTSPLYALQQCFT